MVEMYGVVCGFVCEVSFEGVVCGVCYVNNTNVHFNHNEIELLNKGLKHNLKTNTNNKNQNINEILDLETAIQKTKPEHQENLRQEAKQHTTSQKTHNR